MTTRPKVVWLHSLARSGSSITVYAAAAPWAHVVADEVIGPWDRTGEPYHYPQAQAKLVESFKADNHTLSDRVVRKTNDLFGQIAGPSGVVISKWPHLRPSPEEFSRAFEGDRRAYLIRNPLHRLNSLHKRGWVKSIGAQQDLPRFKQFGQWWLKQPHRLTFDELQSDPRSFYTKLFTAWDFEFDTSHIDQALAYMDANYHDSSLQKSDQSGANVLSEQDFAIPSEAIDMYLGDASIVELMTELGWSIDPADYGGTPVSVGG